MMSVLLDDAADSIDSGGALVLTAIDFAKAFNKLNHNQLIDDFIDMGVDAWLIKLLSSYLKQRKMRVKYKKVMSDLYHMQGGTPQGSLTGVLMFIVYMNELSKAKAGYPNIGLMQFVDDSYIYKKVKREEIQIEDDGTRTCQIDDLNEVIENFINTAKLKEMKVNEKKTELLIIKPQRARATYRADVQVGDQTKSESSQDIKMLGCMVNERLSMDAHVKKILKSGRLRIQTLRNLKSKGVPNDDLKSVYRTIMQPVVEYGLSFLAPMLDRNHLIKLERFQKQSLRVIYGDLPYKHLLSLAGMDRFETRIGDLFKKMVESAPKSKVIRERLAERVGGRELRKRPGLQGTNWRTNIARTTPLNTIRASNVLQTPGRKKLKFDKKYSKLRF
jgi:hypothetical protein